MRGERKPRKRILYSGVKRRLVVPTEHRINLEDLEEEARQRAEPFFFARWYYYRDSFTIATKAKTL